MMKIEHKISLSDVLAIISLILAGVAIWQSYSVRQDARILSKIQFKPNLILRAQLEKINERIPAHISLKNDGPIDAVQVEIQFHFLRYLPTKQTVGVAATGWQYNWAFDKIPPLKIATIKIDESSLERMLPAISENEKHFRILEIRINYRRESDLKKYSESAFYFVSQEGKWVNEKSNALNPEIYDPIIKAALERFNIDSKGLGADPLHEMTEKEMF